MARFRVAVETDIATRYVALRNRIRDAGRADLKRKINRNIKRAGEPALTAVRAATLRIDVTSTGRGGQSRQLRRRVAAATKISTLPSGIRIGVRGRQIDPRYGRSLAFLLYGQGTWRHPVFGDQDVLVEQQGQDAFFETLRPFRREWQAAIEQAMEETVRELDR